MKFLLVLTVTFLAGCATMPVRNTPQVEDIRRYSIENGNFVWQNYEYPKLKEGPVFVAPYSFNDLTGQRKEGDAFASFSSAVTQGGYAWLIEELVNAGNGKWFTVLEREGIQNVMTERNLIKNTRQSFNDKNLPDIKPMAYAGVIIEGGIISYESNFVTRGIGAFSKGLGIGKQYRKDVVTVSLRMVSSQTGQVLLSTTVSKTILSIGSSSTYFRYLDLDTNPELFEAEFGVTNNERSSIAVRCAISAAIVDLINQGHNKSLWELDIDEDHKVSNNIDLLKDDNYLIKVDK
jgi:curli production assembly/transport component CsgG